MLSMQYSIDMWQVLEGTFYKQNNTIYEWIIVAILYLDTHSLHTEMCDI